MSVSIYTMTHVPFTPPEDPVYIPLQVGRALHDGFGYQGDDTGDNISEKNPYYSELTGLYWIWKNDGADYAGLSHYRRHFEMNEEMLRKLAGSDIDVVLTAKGELMNEEEDIIGTDVVPIAKLAGDDYICLDYRKKRGITVAIWYGGESEEFHPVCAK